MAANKKILLKCSDGQTFEVEENIAIQSQIIKCKIEDDGCDDNAFPVPNVTGKIMSMIIEYCNKHAEDDKPTTVAESSAGESSSSDDAPSTAGDSEFIKDWDAKFVNVDFSVLFELIQAANYLNIQKLLALTTQAVANRIKDKMPEEIRKIFSIKNDFTPEEEEQLRKENAWVYEV